ncbi:MAG: hypothetical protein SO101_12120 [Lachnospiraceae bacterium]|nr:hypothetical protein [Lachnospiraceae bacterium]
MMTKHVPYGQNEKNKFDLYVPVDSTKERYVMWVNGSTVPTLTAYGMQDKVCPYIEYLNGYLPVAS